MNIDYTTFYGVHGLRQNSYIDCVEENLKSFFDYAFLKIGGFNNVEVPTSGLYATTFHKLKPIKDPGFTSDTVWQAPKQDWVWETGVSYSGVSPTQITGVIVNGSGVPSPTGSLSRPYTLDYPNGRVIFQQALAPSTNVELSYSYRWCQIIKSSSNQNWRVLQELSYQPNAQINQSSSGIYAIQNNHRVQMPAIVIEPIARNSAKPRELGNLSSYRYQDFLCHIFTENINDRNTIMDILRLQKEKTVILYDNNKVAISGIYGLNANGSKNINGLNYGQIIQNEDLIWNKMYIKEVNFLDYQQNVSSSLFWCITRLTVEIIL